MSIYAFKITKNDIEISLSSRSPEFVKQEYQKFMADFFKVKLEDVLNEPDYIQNEDNACDLTENTDNSPLPVSDKDNEKTSTKKKVLNKLPANFASMLAEKETQESSNVVEKRTSELKNTYIQMQNIINEKKIKNELDYVVAASYCLTHYEKLMHFPEEQIKAKMMPFLKKKFNHDIILDAVAKNFIRVIPDFTGTTDETEYELTECGEEYFLNEL